MFKRTFFILILLCYTNYQFAALKTLAGLTALKTGSLARSIKPLQIVSKNIRSLSQFKPTEFDTYKEMVLNDAKIWLYDKKNLSFQEMLLKLEIVAEEEIQSANDFLYGHQNMCRFLYGENHPCAGHRPYAIPLEQYTFATNHISKWRARLEIYEKLLRNSK